MVRQNPIPVSSNIHQLITRIVESNEIGRREQLQLTSAMLRDKNLTEEDRRQINRIFDHIQSGRIKIIDL
ncbi:hypothetical protein AM228_13980 [Planktothricoides sp. SR001]|nr:hypothetical protein AM228_13980 [Planktothricoides sp. SR001]MBD2582395.1 hypothetical protein [Planktothricoides raciborskii FACHB-1261]